MNKIIKEAQDLLSKNTEWKKRYADYAQAILANTDYIKVNRRKLKEYPPLHYYISTSIARNARNTLLLDVRYRGQSVATMKAFRDGVTISTKGKISKNLRDFDCKIELNDTNWNGKESQKFRSFFKNRVKSRNSKKNKGNEEHNVENLLLSEFSKERSKEKPILNIQPVKLCGIIFGVPTPISASDHKKPLKYAKHHGGGIDIFARTGCGGRSTYLTVIEVKDENNTKEPPLDALKQAIQYSVFIRELLRSSSGNDWYKMFGFEGEMPKSLKIRVACAMPDDISEKSFANTVYTIGCDSIECHYIYFKYDGQKLTDFQTSLNK